MTDTQTTTSFSFFTLKGENHSIRVPGETHSVGELRSLNLRAASKHIVAHALKALANEDTPNDGFRLSINSGKRSARQVRDFFFTACAEDVLRSTQVRALAKSMQDVPGHNILAVDSDHS